jgi:small GTP-binding protein
MASSNRTLPSTQVEFLMLGNEKAGKTALLKQFCDQTFSEDYSPTELIDFKHKQLMTSEVNVRLEVCDTPGKKLISELPESLFMDVNCVAIAMDMTKRGAIDDLLMYINFVKLVMSQALPHIVIFANKYDLTEDYEISEDQVKKFAAEQRIPCYFVTATEYESVAKAFNASIEATLNRVSSNQKAIEPSINAKASAPILEEKPMFSEYLGHWYSIRLFKTHHKERAIAVKTALQKIYVEATFSAYFKVHNEKALKLIKNQITLLEGKTLNEKEVLKELADIDIDKKWVTKMTNVPEKIETSGYYQELIRLKNDVEQILLNNQNTNSYC